MKVGQVVLSRSQIDGLEARLERCSRKHLAEKNHIRHQRWVEAWEREQEQVNKVRNEPQTRVRECVDRAIKADHRPGTLGWVLANKR
jgi:hypothetical protein